MRWDKMIWDEKDYYGEDELTFAIMIHFISKLIAMDALQHFTWSIFQTQELEWEK